MKKLIAYIFLFAVILTSCSGRTDNELMCYALDSFNEDLLNEPYYVKFDQKSLFVRNGNDTIFYCKIDSISKEDVYINDYNVKFVNRELYYTKKGKFLKDNKSLTVKYQEIYAIDSLGNSGESPIEYRFDNWGNPGETGYTFNCVNRMSMDDYNKLIQFKQSHR